MDTFAQQIVAAFAAGVALSLFALLLRDSLGL
jgi:hypothetical protein